MAGFAALLDACVLVPISLSDTLLRLAERDLYRPLWSERILGEVRSALVRVHPEIDAARFDSRLRSMDVAFEDACVTGWEPLVSGLELPDPDDRHVVAAALRGRAEVIVTANIRDFPSDALDPLGIEVLTPDAFLLDLLDLDPAGTARTIREQAADHRRPSVSAEDVLSSLERAGAPEFARRVRVHGVDRAQ